MASKAATASPRLSDEAVKAKTGKIWKEWFTILDLAGAKKMSHQEIVKHLNSEHGVRPWWQQMVTVTYEQARGLRALHQKPGGFEISVSRTVNAPIASVYQAFSNNKARSSWLAGEKLEVRKTTANKSMRATWSDGKTGLAIAFVPKGKGKSQVVVQHSKLPNATASAKMKTYWRKALDRLQMTVEK